MRYGDDGELLYRIEEGRIRPSKMLADSVLGMLHGNVEFVLIDEQKLVFETALELARAASWAPSMSSSSKAGLELASRWWR